MSKILLKEEDINDVGLALNEKGVSGTFTPSQMGDSIRSISGSGTILDTNIELTSDKNSTNSNVTLYAQLNDKYSENYSSENWREIYQEVEWIQSDGSQYIEINYQHKNNTICELVMSYNSYTSYNGYDGILGSRTTYNNSNAFSIFIHNEDLTNCIGGYVNDNFFDLPKDTENTLIISKNNIQLNGTNHTFTSNLTNAPSNWYIFSSHEGSTYTGNLSRMKLYSLKIYENNTLVRDFVPVYHKQEGTIGLYDKVDGVFYDNDGTGTFEKGYDVITGITCNGYIQNTPIKFYKDDTLITTVNTDNNGLATLPQTITETTLFKAQFEGENGKYNQSPIASKTITYYEKTFLNLCYDTDYPNNTYLTYDSENGTLWCPSVHDYYSTEYFTTYDITDSSKTLEVTFTIDNTDSGSIQGADRRRIGLHSFDNKIIIARDIANVLFGTDIDGVYSEIDTGSNYFTTGYDTIKLELLLDKCKLWINNTYIGEYTHQINGNVGIYLNKWQWKKIGMKEFSYRWIQL